MLSEALRLIRVFHDLKQSELAKQFEISNSYLSEIESGKKEPTLELVNKYSQRFKIPSSSIMFFAENIGSKNGSSALAQKSKGIIASKIINFLSVIEARTESDEPENA